MEKKTEEIQRDKEVKIGAEAYYVKRPQFGAKGTSKLRQHFNRGMTMFLVALACVITYFVILRLEEIAKIFWTIVDVAKPIIYGFVIAYLLNPMVKRVENYLYPLIEERMNHNIKAKNIARGVGITVSLMLALLVILALCNMVIPELYNSIKDMVLKLPSQISEASSRLEDIVFDKSTVGVFLQKVINEGMSMFQTWLRSEMIPQTNALMTSVTIGVFNVIQAVFHILIGIMVSVYILFSREKFSAQTKKVIYAVMKPERANMTLHIARKSNQIFGGFIIGKIIDSAIIGVLCFLGMTILDMPYVVLVSVVVGVTNVIPFFGPYIGAIPSTILIMLDSPIKGLYFILFILFLQQLDGNVIGPKILGDSTGLSSFWVIFSIILGGGLFGFVGMVLGVPTFAVIYYIVRTWINQKLEHKKLPVQSEKYDKNSYVTDEGAYIDSEEK